MSSTENLTPEQRANLVKIQRALRLATLYQLGSALNGFSGDLMEVVEAAFADPGTPTEEEMEKFFSDKTADLLHEFLVGRFEDLLRFVPILGVGVCEISKVPASELPSQSAPGTSTLN